MGRYLLGVLLAAVSLVPIGLGSRALRRVMLPGWRGLESWLAELVLALVTVTLVAEVLGTLGLFATGPVVISLALVGGLTAVLVPRLARDEGVVAPRVSVLEAPTTSRSDGWQTVAAGIVLMPLIGSWATRTLRSLDDGMTTFDTLWYHLTVAARFVQTGRTGSIQFIDSDPVTAYFPASSSLLHATGMLLFGTDVVSTVVNMGWLVVALAAAWMIGRPFGVAPLTTVAAGLLFATPVMVATQPGGVLNDVAGLALLLVAVALAVRDTPADRTIRQDLVVSLAAGMAIGFKFTFILPALAIVAALVVTARSSPPGPTEVRSGLRGLVAGAIPRGSRRRRALVVGTGWFVAGGYWYLRNWVATGNPLPSLEVNLGPVHLPFVRSNFPTGRFSDYVFDGDAWRDYLLPGLEDALGPVWWALLAMVAIGMVGGILHPSHRARMVGVLAVVDLTVYTVSPQYIEALGEPYFFATNLRYAGPGLILGLVLFPIVARRWSWWALGVMGLVMVATQLDRVAWPSPLDRESFFHDPITGTMTASEATRGLVAVVVIAVVLGALGLLASRCPGVTRFLERAWVLVPVVAILALALVHTDYTRDRYTQYRGLAGSYRWAADVRDARIGVSGGVLQLQYPFTGPEWDNHVQYIGVEDGKGGFRSARTCTEWVERLEADRYDYVVVMTPDLRAWTLTQPDARIVGRRPRAPDDVTVIALDPATARRSC